MASDLPRIEGATARPVAFADLDGWAQDDHAAAFRVFRTHCAALSGQAAALRQGAIPPASLLAICGSPELRSVATGDDARKFFERWFEPHEITPDSGRGFLTGYYEPETDGS
ncbi:MAG: lytic murein transglycosylase, partial [Beijerinckiaceae bacterium]